MLKTTILELKYVSSYNFCGIKDLLNFLAEVCIKKSDEVNHTTEFGSYFAFLLIAHEYLFVFHK